MIKFLFKSVFGCLISAVLGVVILMVVVFYVALSMVRPSVETAISQTTGFDTKIAEMDINPFTLRLDSHDFVINNPSGYTDNRFVSLRRVLFDLDNKSLSGEVLVVEEAVIDIAHIGYIVEGSGDSVKKNALEFSEKVKSLLDSGSAQEQTEQSGTEEPAAPTPFLIKKLTFRLDDVYWVKNGSEKNFNANIDMTFTDVDDVNDIVGPLRQELTARGMGFLVTGLLTDVLQGLGSRVTGSIEGLTELGGELGVRAAELGGRAAEVGGEVVGEGAKQAGAAVKGIFNKLKKEEGGE